MSSSARSAVMTAVLACSTCTGAVFAQANAAPSIPSKPLTNAQVLQQLDPQMAQVVLLLDAIRGTPLIDLTPQDARQQFGAEDAEKVLARGLGKQPAPEPVGKVIDGMTILGPAGNQIPIRIYVPAGNGSFPVTVYYHGGGFVIATIDTYDASARALCNGANTIVVSVEYRKAPEAPYPAARLDAIAAYQWALANIRTYNGDNTRVAVAGESAGGNLATEVALAARDQGFQAPVHELLVYPVTSSNYTQASDLAYTSPLLPLNTPQLPYFGNLYVPNAAEANDPGVAPINADLHNLPATTIVAAELDPLRSDGLAYAAKLQASQVPVAYRVYAGTTHEFFGMGAVVDKAAAAEAFASQRLGGGV